MKNILYCFFMLFALGCAKKVKYADYPISDLNLRDVVISDSFWLPKISTIQDVTIQYAFDKCDKEGRMENFLIAGGKKKGKVKGKFVFDDTDLYKIIEGASNSLISKPNPVLDAYIDSIISIIKIGQEPDGYIATWFTIDSMNPPCNWCKPSKKRWEHEETNHELYNSGHLFEAASAHYLATGKTNFLEIALKNADLLVKSFGPGKLQVPPGHQIVETGLIKLYRITHNDQYLQLAKNFLEWRGDSTTHKLYGEYNQDHMPVVKQAEAVGHAVRAEYMYAAMTDIAVMYKDSAYLNAVMNIWDNIVNNKMYLTGGVGSRHYTEAFGNNYELPNLKGYNETCAAIGSVLWNNRLFLRSGDSKYFDIIERTLYNGLISGISLDGKNFFYPNPLESDGKFTFNMGACTRSPWFDCSCCPTNMIRFIPSVPGLIYATDKNNLYVNLFISNKAQASLNGKKVQIIQETEYPLNGKILITINPEEKSNFTINLRFPGWAQNKAVPGNLYNYVDNFSDSVYLGVNGKEEKISLNKGYIEISRDWNKGDKIEVYFPMKIRKVVANSNVKEDSSKVAFEYGPLVYCAEEIDNKNISNISIAHNISLTTERTNILSENVNVIKGKESGKEFTLIPYYLWSNRGVGKMKVWFPEK